MKNMGFWAGRYAMAATGMFVIVVGAAMLQGGTLAEEWLEALAWALASSGIFIVSRYRAARRGEACALCRDTAKD